jgi:hypothetical protein
MDLIAITHPACSPIGKARLFVLRYAADKTAPTRNSPTREGHIFVKFKITGLKNFGRASILLNKLRTLI